MRIINSRRSDYQTMTQPDYTPTIVAFCCHYCAYAAADLAGNPLFDAPVAWSFTTETDEYYIYLPLVLRQ